MAWREAVKVTRDAFATNMQTKLDALSVVTGETAPTIADFRDEFSDDDPIGDDYPLVQVLTDLVAEGEFEAFGKADIRVPLLVRYLTRDPDVASARATASYALRAAMQVLNDVASGTTENSVQFIQYQSPRPQIGVDPQGHVAMELRFLAQMRDLSP